MIAADLAVLAVPIDKLALLPGNPRRGDVEAIAASLGAFGQRKPVVATRDGTVIAGNHTLLAARSLGWDEVAVVWVDDDDTTAHAYALADNRTAELGGYDDAALATLIAEVHDADAELLLATGWTGDDLKALLASIAEDAHQPTGISLADRFGVPPFSVLDARQGYWRERKQQWLELGISSGLGRDARAYGPETPGDPVSQKVHAVSGGISLFDPVLCELVYRWFAPSGGTVLDPFAGGSVRGVVAATTGHPYLGIDLSADQLAANAAQWPGIAERLPADVPVPDWRHGDSREVIPTLGAERFDLVFSCPPYANLETYTDDPCDISNMDYDAFLKAYADIISAAVDALRPERFAVFVVGDLRGPGGFYRGFPADTLGCFTNAGAALYNDAVLVTAVATASLRAGGQFEKGRKLCKVHQNVLVFYKGTDPLGTVASFGPVSFGDVAEAED